MIRQINDLKKTLGIDRPEDLSGCASSKSKSKSKSSPATSVGRHVHFLEIEFSRAVKAGKDDRATMHQRWLNSAEKRLLQSVKALAQTGRLLGPSLQVNIAEKQINVAS